MDRLEVERATFLDLLSEPDRLELERRAGRRRFKRGATLMNEGGPGAEVMLLVAGRVKVTVTTAGREIVLGFQGPGELIGELAVIDDEPRSGTTEALEPVEALAIGAADFHALLERPTFATAMLRSLVRRFRDADRGRIEFAASQSLGRVASRLVELAEHHGRPAIRTYEEAARNKTVLSAQTIKKSPTINAKAKMAFAHNGARGKAIKARHPLTMADKCIVSTAREEGKPKFTRRWYV